MGLHLIIKRNPLSGLYALCDNTPCPDRSHASLAFDLLCGGAQILQLRMKNKTARGRREVAQYIMKLKQKFHFSFIVNDDPELVRDLGADGVHVGSDDLEVSACRRFLGPLKYIGYSAHSLREAREAEAAGADYVAFGAIFPSPSKGPGHPVQGIRNLKKVVSSLQVPVVAIGGITHENVPSVLKTGVTAVAMISALAAAPNVTSATQQMVQIMREFLHPGPKST